MAEAARAGTPRLPALPPWLVALAALAAALAVGTVMVRSAQLGVIASGGLAYVPLVLLNLPLGIALWVASVPLSTVTPAPNLAGLLVLFAWVGVVLPRRVRMPALQPLHRHTLLATGALVLWVLTSMAWAPRSAVGTELFFSWLVVAAVMCVLSTTVVESRHLRWVATAFVTGMVLSVAIGTFGGSLAPEGAAVSAEGRVVGASGDPNFLAAGIVPAIVLAFALSGRGAGVLRRSALLVAVGVLVVGLVGTQSRGGLVSAALAAAVALVVAKRARAALLVALLGTVGAAALWTSMHPAAWERMSNLGESSGRSELWQVGWRMWQDHPVTGVGLDGFRDHSADYVFAFGPLRYAEYIVEVPKLVHNAYLELLAETGIVGLALFATIVVLSLRCAWTAATRFTRMGDLQMAALARGTVVALLAILTASFSLSNTTDRRTWILLALGPALLAASHAASTATASPTRLVDATGNRAARVPAGRPAS